MKITILPQGTLAIYEQIVNQLKNAVVTGELKAGEALPSIRHWRRIWVSVSLRQKERMRNWKKKDWCARWQERAFMSVNIMRIT